MKKFVFLGLFEIGLSVLFACSPASVAMTDATTTNTQATLTMLPGTATPTTDLQAAKEAPPDSQEPVSLPLGEPGPYYAGKRTFTFDDASRDGRRIEVTVLYPAVRPEGSAASHLLAGTDLDPDLSGAPYPLILTGPDSGFGHIRTHLASHGFVMAIVRFPDSYNYWGKGIFDHPRDLLFALDQIASKPLEGLAGVIDSDLVGITGYSWEGLYSLALSGVRVNPEYYLSYCEQQLGAIEPELSAWYLKYVCNLSKEWDAFAAYVGDEITVSVDGLWQPLTDERIRAVVPMAEYGTWLYGEQGLATADRPVLIIALTDDESIPYQIEVPYVFEHLGTPERFLISIIGKGHMMVIDPEQAKRLNHFAAAFFGYYLQGRDDYAVYFSEEFVTQFDDLAWGVYEGN